MICRDRLGQKSKCMAWALANSPETYGFKGFGLSWIAVFHFANGFEKSYGPIPGRTIKHREYFHLAKGWSLKPLWIFGTDDPKLHLRSRLRIQHGLEPQNGFTLAAMSLRRLVGPAQRWTSWTKIIDFDSGNPRGLGLCQLNEWPCIF